MDLAVVLTWWYRLRLALFLEKHVLDMHPPRSGIGIGTEANRPDESFIYRIINICGEERAHSPMRWIL